MKHSASVGKKAGVLIVMLCVLGMISGLPVADAAAKYPAKAVTVIHGFKAGGGSDQLAHVTQPFLEKVLKQRFVNVYKPGATGAIAWKEVGKDTKPDGSVIFDDHALGCSLCVDITQDARRMLSEGKSAQDIRATIVANYSKFGPPNQ